MCECLCGFHNDVIGIGPAFCHFITYLPSVEPAFSLSPSLSVTSPCLSWLLSPASHLLSTTSFRNSRTPTTFSLTSYFLSAESATAGCSSAFWANELGLQGHCSCRRVTLRKARTSAGGQDNSQYNYSDRLVGNSAEAKGPLDTSPPTPLPHRSSCVVSPLQTNNLR